MTSDQNILKDLDKSKRNTVIKIFLISFLVFAGLASQAQEKPKSVEKQRKEFLNLQKERDEGAAAAQKENIKKHEKIQTKDVQKRMKKTRRRSERIQRKKHKDNIFERTFTKKPKRR